ncbi:MAG: aspartate-semialdehyde dehydrogenase [Chlamydiales bacterium]|jgi:aspartate-semialdehyde dehydrogenase
MQKYKVGILGATGMVGQKYISLLNMHPWFEVCYLVASERSAGKTYAEAVANRWHLKSAIPEKIAKLTLFPVDDIASAIASCSFVFSALDTQTAKTYEEQYAKAGLPLVSNASAHRFTPDVPLLIPEVNAHHLDIIPIQQKNRGWEKGFIVTKPNCSIQSYLTPLYALHKQFKIKRVIATTMQAVSGAGHADVASMDMHDNIVPFIKGEEEKSENEPRKILGSIAGKGFVENCEFLISAHCNRVPVTDGHMACVSVEFENKPEREEILSIWESFRSAPQELNLPSAPNFPLLYREEPDRPQPRYDRDNDHGMATTLGRLRECNVLDYRFVGLSHNTIRGAAGGAILTAELIAEKGLFSIER